MGKSAPSPPAAPDPAKTSAAQTASNKETALYQFGLSNPNYNTPLGNLSYNVDTSNPAQARTTANVQLSPEQQQLYNQTTQQGIGLSNLAGQLQGRVGDTLNMPPPGSADFDTASQNAQNAYYKNQTQFLDPQWEQGKTSLDAELANKGIMPGSEAYNNVTGNFSRQKQAAYDTAQNNAILQGPQNAQQLYALSTAARNQPLTEFNALRTGAQPQMPQFQGTQPTNVGQTNVLGAAQMGYQGALNNYNQQVGQQNNMTSGLFSLGAAAAPFLFSDFALKENIIHVGNERGLPIYHFSYKADPEHQIYRGVMAQDVLLVMPQAVMCDGEYLSVDYGKLGIEFGRVH